MHPTRTHPRQTSACNTKPRSPAMAAARSRLFRPAGQELNYNLVFKRGSAPLFQVAGASRSVGHGPHGGWGSRGPGLPSPRPRPAESLHGRALPVAQPARRAALAGSVPDVAAVWTHLVGLPPCWPFRDETAVGPVLLALEICRAAPGGSPRPKPTGTPRSRADCPPAPSARPPGAPCRSARPFFFLLSLFPPSRRSPPPLTWL